MATKRMRNKNYAVPTQDEDFTAVRGMNLGLTPEQLQAAATLRAAMRNAQAILGPGYRPLDIVCERLPRPYVENWARGRLH